MQSRFLRWLYERFFRGRERQYLDASHPYIDDYRYNCEPRYGYGKRPHEVLYRRIDAGRSDYSKFIKELVQFERQLSAFAIPNSNSSSDPSFFNEYLLGLDPIALYGILALTNPQRYVEIGSGYSTLFAKRSITDHQLRTRLISIDPDPRTNIDSLCDKVYRSPLERVDLKLFDELESGDILFVDNSHRTLMNSDATIVALEILPRLKPGVQIHFHDIFLPYDYPPAWRNRFYSEQYLLASTLLADSGRYHIQLPNAFVSLDPELHSIAMPLWQHSTMQEVYRYSQRLMHGYLGYSFWLTAPSSPPPIEKATETIHR